MSNLDQLIEIKSHEREGYKPLIYHSDWMVAMLNYFPEVDRTSMKKMEKHCHTDEVFVLLQGRAVLLVASGSERVDEIHPISMKKGVFYNVHQRVWHYIAMSRDARVVIVEKRDTNLNDFVYYHLSEEQVEKVKKEIQPLL